MPNTNFHRKFIQIKTFNINRKFRVKLEEIILETWKSIQQWGTSPAVLNFLTNSKFWRKYTSCINLNSCECLHQNKQNNDFINGPCLLRFRNPIEESLVLLIFFFSYGKYKRIALHIVKNYLHRECKQNKIKICAMMKATKLF